NDSFGAEQFIWLRPDDFAYVRIRHAVVNLAVHLSRKADTAGGGGSGCHLHCDVRPDGGKHRNNGKQCHKWLHGVSPVGSNDPANVQLLLLVNSTRAESPQARFFGLPAPQGSLRARSFLPCISSAKIRRKNSTTCASA